MTDLTVDDLNIDRSGDILTLRLNRPKNANALGPDLVEQLIEVFEKPTDARLIVIEGEGKTFCAGFDLRDIGSLSDGDLLLRFVRVEHMLQLINHSPTLVMCCAHRYAIGAGADLLAAASIRVVTPNISMRMPGLGFDLVLGTRRLATLVGGDTARDILLDTRSFDADEALRIGFVTEIADRAAWPNLIEQAASRAAVLSPQAQAQLFARTRIDTRANDMAALVASAGRPGLRKRVESYQQQMAQQGK